MEIVIVFLIQEQELILNMLIQRIMVMHEPGVTITQLLTQMVLLEIFLLMLMLIRDQELLHIIQLINNVQIHIVMATSLVEMPISLIGMEAMVVLVAIVII